MCSRTRTRNEMGVMAFMARPLLMVMEQHVCKLITPQRPTKSCPRNTSCKTQLTSKSKTPTIPYCRYVYVSVYKFTIVPATDTMTNNDLGEHVGESTKRPPNYL